MAMIDKGGWMSAKPLIYRERQRQARSLSNMWMLLVALVPPAIAAVVMHRVLTTQVGLFPDDGWGTSLVERFGMHMGTAGMLVTAAAALLSISVVIPLTCGGFIAGAREDGRFDDIRLTRVGEVGFIWAGLYLAMTRMVVLIGAMSPLVVLSALHTPLSLSVVGFVGAGLVISGVVVCVLTVWSSALAQTSRSGITRSLLATFVVVWLPLVVFIGAQLVGVLQDPQHAASTVATADLWNTVSAMSPASISIWGIGGATTSNSFANPLAITSVGLAAALCVVLMLWAHRRVQQAN